MHVSLDSALGRQRRLNSVGESVLQIAPNALTAYSLRSLTGGDPKVVRVRRDTDNAEQDFTASGVSSGALTSFTNADYAKYTSDFSSGDDSWGSFDDVTETGNIDGIGGLDNNLRLAIGTATSDHRAFRSSILPVGQKINFSARVFVPSTNSDVDGILIRDANNTVIVATTAPTQDEWVTVTANDVTVANAQLRVNLQKGAASNFTGNGSDVVYLREVTVTQVTSDGFVETWYDQSGNSNDVVQATAGSQPKIVSAGSLVTGGLRFDDAQKLETASTASFGDGTTLSTFITNSSDGDEASYLFRFSSDYIIFNNSAGLRRVHAGISANAGTASGSEELWSTISTINSSGGTTNFFADGVLKSSADANIGTKTVSNRVLNIGGSSSGTHWNGTVNEVIFYATDQTSNRVALESNIMTNYGIS